MIEKVWSCGLAYLTREKLFYASQLLYPNTLFTPHLMLRCNARLANFLVWHQHISEGITFDIHNDFPDSKADLIDPIGKVSIVDIVIT